MLLVGTKFVLTWLVIDTAFDLVKYMRGFGGSSLRAARHHLGVRDIFDNQALRESVPIEIKNDAADLRTGTRILDRLGHEKATVNYSTSALSFHRRDSIFWDKGVIEPMDDIFNPTVPRKSYLDV